MQLGQKQLTQNLVVHDVLIHLFNDVFYTY